MVLRLTCYRYICGLEESVQFSFPLDTLGDSNDLASKLALLAVE